jgi:hypothetical protein
MRHRSIGGRVGRPLRCRVGRRGRHAGAAAGARGGAGPARRGRLRSGVARWPLGGHAGDAPEPPRRGGGARSDGNGAGHPCGTAGRARHRRGVSEGPGMPRDTPTTAPGGRARRDLRRRAPAGGVRQRRARLGPQTARRGSGGPASGRPPVERGGGRARRAGRRRRGDDARGGRGARAV